MYLSMAVVTTGDAILCTTIFYLIVLYLSISKPLFFKARLQKAAAAATTVIVGLIGIHLRNIFLTHRLTNCKSEIVRNFIPKAFTYNLAGILDSELDFQIFIPVRIWFQLAFPNPLGIIFVNVFCFEVVSYVEFFQSGPDCKCYVASFRIEIRLALEFIGHVGLRGYKLLPILIIG